MAEEQLATGHGLEAEESQISPPLGTPVRPTMPYDRGISTPVGGHATPARQALFQGLEFSTPGASGVKAHSGYEGYEEDCAVCLEPLGDDSLQHTMHCKHRFHTQCLRQMRGHDLSACPMCRAPITPGWTPANRPHPSSPLFRPEGMSMRDAIVYRAAAARRAVQERILREQRALGRRRQLFADGTDEAEEVSN